MTQAERQATERALAQLAVPQTLGQVLQDMLEDEGRVMATDVGHDWSDVLTQIMEQYPQAKDLTLGEALTQVSEWFQGLPRRDVRS